MGHLSASRQWYAPLDRTSKCEPPVVRAGVNVFKFLSWAFTRRLGYDICPKKWFVFHSSQSKMLASKNHIILDLNMNIPEAGRFVAGQHLCTEVGLRRHALSSGGS
ncbi:hypothetical protein AVEN_194933-1 [Araneus ventricosus]|uniref:Uncharacterized protein n=1 Tax=Araneus ventricosus TaxID=182803 RepID=A0A4Y2UEB1_ARAVE|nr:hypothetical protein AVEN_194933-1 [Araneus ventricosus]